MNKEVKYLPLINLWVEEIIYIHALAPKSEANLIGTPVFFPPKWGQDKYVSYFKYYKTSC